MHLPPEDNLPMTEKLVAEGAQGQVDRALGVLKLALKVDPHDLLILRWMFRLNEQLVEWWRRVQGKVELEPAHLLTARMATCKIQKLLPEKG